ncbi:MAG: alpha/beta fold hydrolase [Parahaliea sp.]
MPDDDHITYRSSDGLALYARDYRTAPAEAPVLLCLHGLTRNSADFASLAEHLAGGFRVICADQRGRGRSDYDPQPARYQPLTYVEDMFTLLDHLQVARVTVIGTSMGGLMGMLMAARQPERISALVLNDIGPEVDPRGLARIQSYVGKSAPVSDWQQAVAQVRAINGSAFPDFSQTQWRDFAGKIYREQNGVPVLNYDSAIAAPIDSSKEAAVPPDLWPLFESLSQPLLLVRGELSDILAASTAAGMCERGQDCRLVEIPGRGHAPTLDEAPARRAIDDFLGALAG